MGSGNVVPFVAPPSAALGVVVDAVERLASAQDAQQVADIIRGAARKLTGADGICVVLLKGDRVHYVAEDAVSPLWAGQDFPVDSCISGWAIKNRQTVVIEDIRIDPRIPLAAYEPTFVKSLVMTPVGLKDPIAAIGAYWATPRRPSAEEISTLESVARAATVALDSVRLRQHLAEAYEMARAADAAKSAFLANMSHEIRTPLNGVTAMTALLLDTKLDARQQEMLQVIARAADQAARLVGDVIDYSRIESGGLDLVLEDVDLCEAVEALAMQFAPRAFAKGLSFDVDYSPKVRGLFRADRVRFTQIVQNILSNAVKFTEKGGVTVRVEEEGRIGDRSMITIAISDTGIGFDADTRERLFARFHQGDTSLTRRQGGLGLGLAGAQAVAGAMGGIVEAQSQPGYGSTFVVRIPFDRVSQEWRAPAGAPAPAAIPAPLPTPAAPPSVFTPRHTPATAVIPEPDEPPPPLPEAPKKLRILCAEDNPMNQMVLRLSLQALDAEIMMVEDGAQALAAMAKAAPDVILMDMQMPVLDGLEATRRIRALERDQRLLHTPIVMVTANAMQQHREQAVAAGVDAFVTKPTTPDMLVKAVRKAVAG